MKICTRYKKIVLSGDIYIVEDEGEYVRIKEVVVR